MIMELYAIKDELSEFAAPQVHKDEANAKRWFRMICEDNGFMKANPEDFSLWLVGGYDTETACVTSLMPKLIERAKSHYTKEVKNDGQITIPNNS